ncbi:MAG: hypothetical protein H5U01_10645 [Clostridia bacterium]|nr:hypothetical protein [Clostridia bacterium]
MGAGLGKPLGAVALSETGRVAVLPLDDYHQLLVNVASASALYLLFFRTRK